MLSRSYRDGMLKMKSKRERRRKYKQRHESMKRRSSYWGKLQGSKSVQFPKTIKIKYQTIYRVMHKNFFSGRKRSMGMFFFFYQLLVFQQANVCVCRNFCLDECGCRYESLEQKMFKSLEYRMCSHLKSRVCSVKENLECKKNGE